MVNESINELIELVLCRCNNTLEEDSFFSKDGRCNTSVSYFGCFLIFDTVA